MRALGRRRTGRDPADEARRRSIPRSDAGCASAAGLDGRPSRRSTTRCGAPSRRTRGRLPRARPWAANVHSAHGASPAGRRCWWWARERARPDDPDAPIGNGRAISVLAARRRRGRCVRRRRTRTRREETAGWSRRRARMRAVRRRRRDATTTTVRGIVDDAARALGGLDALVCNVGIGLGRGLEGTSVEEWDTVQCGQRARALLVVPRRVAGDGRRRRDRARSRRSRDVVAGTRIPAYDTSKAAFAGLGRHVALEGARRGVRGECGRARIDRHAARAPGDRRAGRAATDAPVPLGRQATAWEVAAPVVFLLSDDASYITGQISPSMVDLTRPESVGVMTFDRDEVEAAFRTYWQLGAVGEAVGRVVRHVLHRRRRRTSSTCSARRRAAKPCARGSSPRWREYGEIYTAYEWHMIGDDGRVVVYMQNRRDNPEPGTPPIDFPGLTVLQYAGNGMFSLEEDFWSLPEGTRDVQAVRRPRARQFDPRLPEEADPAELGQRPGLDAGRRRPTMSALMPGSAADAGARRARSVRGSTGADVRGILAARVHGAEDVRPAARCARGCPPGAGRPARQVRVVVVRQRIADPVPPVAGRPPRLRDAAQTTKPKGSVVRWRVLRRSSGVVARARHRAQGRLVGARGPATTARSTGSGPEATSDEFADVGARVDRRASDPHDLARSAHGRRRRARLRRRRVAPSEVVAVRVAEVADA